MHRKPSRSNRTRNHETSRGRRPIHKAYAVGSLLPKLHSSLDLVRKKARRQHHCAKQRVGLKQFRDLLAIEYIDPSEIRSADLDLIGHFRSLLGAVFVLGLREWSDTPPGSNCRR